MKTSDFYYDLPQELIAQTPLDKRDASRLMTLDRVTGETAHHHFYERPDVLRPGEAQDIIIAGMGAQTIMEILDAAPWVFDERYNLILVPATKHSLLRRWLAQRGFALRDETLCNAAGRWYTVMNARYTGECFEPSALWCLSGRTQNQPGAQDYRTQQLVKVKKYRLGLAPGEQADEVDTLIREMEEDKWP